MLKIIVSIFSTITKLILICLFCILIISRTTPGRQFACILASKIAKVFYSADIKFSGWNGAHNIENIEVKMEDEIVIKFNDVRSSLNGRFSVDIKEFALECANSKVDLSKQINNLQSLMKNIRCYISDLDLKNGILNLSCGRYDLISFNYKSVENQDVIFSKIYNKKSDEIGFLKFNLAWGEKCKSLTITFNNFFHSTGEVDFQNVEKQESEAKFSLTYNDQYKVYGTATYKKFMSNLIFSSLQIDGTDFQCNFVGDMSLNDEKIKGKANIKFPQLFQKAEHINKNYKELTVLFNGEYNFDGHMLGDIFIKSSDSIIANGNIKCDDNYSISLDISKLDLFKIKCKNLKVDIINESNSKKILSIISGDNWALKGSTIFSNNYFKIYDFSFLHKSCKTHLVYPIIIKNEEIISGSLDIKYNDIKFLHDVFKINADDISGSGEVNINIADGVTSAHLITEKILYKNIAIYDFDIQSRKKNLEIKSNGIEVSKIMISDINLSLKENGFSLNCLVNDDELNVRGLLKNSGISDYEIKINALKFNNPKAALSSSDLLISYNNGNIKLKSPEINVLTGKLSLDINKFGENLTAKIDCDKIPLGIIQSFKDDLESRFWKNLHLNLKANFHGLCNNILGTLDTKIFNSAVKQDIFDGKCELFYDHVSADIKYGRSKDEISAKGKIPIALSLQDGVRPLRSSNNELSINVNAFALLENIIIGSDDINLKGEVSSNFNVSGSLSAPVLNGWLKLNKSIFESFGISIKNINIDLLASNNMISIKNASAHNNKGKVGISGVGKFIADDNILPNVICDFMVNFDNFLLLNSDSLKARVNGNVNVKGKATNPKLSGKIKMINGDFDSSYISKNNYENIEVIRSGKKPKPIFKKEKDKKIPCDLDIDVACDNLKIHGDSWESIFYGPLNISNTINAITIDGILKLKDGNINVLGVRFVMQNGRIKFYKQHPLSPEINILSSAMIKGMQVFIKVESKSTGKVLVDFYSRPAHTVDYILSKILFDKPSQELRLSESTKLYESVKNLNQQKSALSVLNKIKELMFFDSISFSQDVDDFTQKESQTISAGKYISDKVYIGIEKTSEKDTSCNVKINISPQVTLEADSRGDVGVNWMYRY